MCPSGATCLPMGHCLSELALVYKNPPKHVDLAQGRYHHLQKEGPRWLNELGS